MVDQQEVEINTAQIEESNDLVETLEITSDPIPLNNEESIEPEIQSVPILFDPTMNVPIVYNGTFASVELNLSEGPNGAVIGTGQVRVNGT